MSVDSAPGNTAPINTTSSEDSRANVTPTGGDSRVASPPTATVVSAVGETGGSTAPTAPSVTKISVASQTQGLGPPPRSSSAPPVLGRPGTPRASMAPADSEIATIQGPPGPPRSSGSPESPPVLERIERSQTAESGSFLELEAYFEAPDASLDPIKLGQKLMGQIFGQDRGMEDRGQANELPAVYLQALGLLPVQHHSANVAPGEFADFAGALGMTQEHWEYVRQYIPDFGPDVTPVYCRKFFPKASDQVFGAAGLPKGDLKRQQLPAEHQVPAKKAKSTVTDLGKVLFGLSERDAKLGRQYEFEELPEAEYDVFDEEMEEDDFDEDSEDED